MTQKLKKLLSKKILLAGAALLLCLVVFLDFAIRARLSGAAAALAVQIRYGSTIQESFKTASRQLDDPLGALDIDIDKYGYGGNCFYDDGFGTVRCTSTLLRGSSPVVDADYLESHAKQIAHLERLLSQYNWQIETAIDDNTSSLSGLINPDETAAWHAAGYHGFIDYHKTINGVHCQLKITRFDDIFGVLVCRKTVKPFWTRLAI